MDDEAYPDALPAGYRLHWYVLERVLGQGGFGITYLARDPNLDRHVAIKEYLPTEIARRHSDISLHARTQAQAERYTWGLERFLAEARTLARFDHPNIVRVHSVFEANNSAYMVMRFEEGENLAKLLERGGPQNERQVTNWLLPILDGLQLVHAAGFIHRDIKPENIYVRADGSPVLLDFGSARQSFGGSKTVTILVAPGYAPLEQYYGDASTQGPWTDIYALGATCYRAITGQPPLDAIVRAKGVLGSAREVLQPVVELARGVLRAQFLAAVDHALQLRERDRPQDIGAWRHELVAADASASDAAKSAPQIALEAPLPARPGAPSGGAAPKRSGPGWRLGATISAVGALVCAAAVMTLLPGRSSRSGTAGPARPTPAPAAPGSTSPTLAVLERPRPAAVSSVIAAPVQVSQAPPPGARALDPPVARSAIRSEAKAASTSPPVRRSDPAVDVALSRPIAGTSDPLLSTRPAPMSSVGSATAVGQAPREPPSPRSARDGDIDAAEAALQNGDLATAERILAPWVRARIPRAQMLLGRVREGRAGQASSPFEAYVLYSLAARGGESSAKALQAKVAAKLQSAEILQAQRQVESLIAHDTLAASAAQ